MMHKTLRSLSCAIAITAMAATGAGCATTSTTTQSWGGQQLPPAYQGGGGQTGRVEWIQATRGRSSTKATRRSPSASRCR